MTDDRPLLALDTSGVTARVALVTRGGRCLARAERTAARHSSNLLSLCDEILRAAGVRPDALAGIGCGAGPGSFTGLRVGLAAAKGLALPWDTPLVLVSSLHALAEDLLAAADVQPYTADTRGRMLAVSCIDAGKGEVHARCFTPTVGAQAGCDAVAEPLRMPAEALCDHLRAETATRLVFGGTGVDRHPDVFARAFPRALRLSPSPGPSGQAIARLAWARLEQGERDDLSSAVPLYGRPPDITAPRRR